MAKRKSKEEKPAAPKAAKKQTKAAGKALSKEDKQVAKSIGKMTRAAAKRPTSGKKAAPKKAAAKKPVQAPVEAESRLVTEEEIRQLAHLKWEEAGRPDGDGLHFWFQAEHELRQKP